jgi:hypothetical protein
MRAVVSSEAVTMRAPLGLKAADRTCQDVVKDENEHFAALQQTLT